MIYKAQWCKSESKSRPQRSNHFSLLLVPITSATSNACFRLLQGIFVDPAAIHESYDYYYYYYYYSFFILRQRLLSLHDLLVPGGLTDWATSPGNTQCQVEYGPDKQLENQVLINLRFTNVQQVIQVTTTIAVLLESYIQLTISTNLTDYIQLIGVINAAILVFHHTGIVSLVRGHYRFHDDGPHMVTDLKVIQRKKKKFNVYTIALDG